MADDGTENWKLGTGNMDDVNTTVHICTTIDFGGLVCDRAGVI